MIGIITLFVTASGVFGEMQQSLNAIWKVDAQGSSLSRLVRARAASLELVAALLHVARLSRSERGDFGAAMFAAIFKILPDRSLEWRDVQLDGQ